MSELGDRRGRQADAELIVLDFLGNSDQHFRLQQQNKTIFAPFARNVPRFLGQQRSSMADYAAEWPKREILCE
jgi:hypothetical protein